MGWTNVNICDECDTHGDYMYFMWAGQPCSHCGSTNKTMKIGKKVYTHKWFNPFTWGHYTWEIKNDE